MPSLVGSEMCIRDHPTTAPSANNHISFLSLDITHNYTAYSKFPPPKTSLFFIRKTLKCVLSEGSHTVKNPGYRDFKSSYYKKIMGTEMFQIPYWKKIPGTGISNPGTGRKFRSLGFEMPALEKNHVY